MEVLLVADRFYGTTNLIRYCQNLGWGYRIRPKGHLILRKKGGEIQTKELLPTTIKTVDRAELSDSGVFASIGVLHDEKHEEARVYSHGL